MTRYYISGPMTGYPEKNFPAFQKAKDTLTAMGYQVLSPHECEEAVPADSQWSDFVRYDLIQMLTHCSGLILIHGWPQSFGARLELHIALALGWPVLYFDGEKLHDFNRAEQ